MAANLGRSRTAVNGDVAVYRLLALCWPWAVGSVIA